MKEVSMPTLSSSIVVVTGIPRCGSSLLMRMLHAGGMRTFAENTVSFEHPATLSLLRGEPSPWMRECQGKAVKILEPLYGMPPAGFFYRFLLLRRNPVEQAKSQRKFLQILQGKTLPARAMPTLIASIKRDVPRIRKALARLGNVYEVHFENLLRQPEQEAAGIAAFLADVQTMDVKAMAAVVLPRGPECLPVLLELYSFPGQTRENPGSEEPATS